LAETPRLKELYEFGPFRVDAEKETLLRAGEPVALTPKTFQILLVLVRHGQEVVTKDDLLKTVWPGTFVEEANLSRTIFMLRKALGEIPQDHRYILTVPGTGYRLAENVRLVPNQEFSLVAAKHQKVEVQVTEKRPPRWAIALAAVLGVAAAVGAWRFFWHRPVLSAKDTVVLAEFANSTGDRVFDDTLRQGLAVQLEQSPYLSLVPEERIRHTLTLMGQPEDARLTPKTAQQVCERLGSAAVIEGSIARIGTRYVLGLHAADCSTGEALDDEQVQVAREEDVLGALTQIAGKFRSRAGESLATIQRHATPLAEASTPSLEALKAYSAAWQVKSSNPQQAILLLQRAIQIDPDFAMAYSLQGRLYADIWEPVLSQQSTSRAYQLRNRASDRERFFIEVNYQDGVAGDLEKAQEICRLWVLTYPRDMVPHAELTWTDQELGKYDDSIQEASQAIALDPDFTPGYNNLAWAYVLSDRLDQAEQTLQRAADRKLEMPEMLVMRYYIAFLKGDKAAMEEAAARAQGQSEAEDWLTYEQATVLALSGHLKLAQRMSSRAAQLALQANQPERAAMYRAGIAVREAFYGEAPEAKQNARAALALSHGRDVEWGAALAYALSGDFPDSRNLAIHLEKRFPQDTFVRIIYLPELRALEAMHDKDPAKALDLLQSAAPFELGVPGSAWAFFGSLYPVYLRGEVYLAGHQASDSVAEFQKVLAHPGIVFTDPVAALTHLELGRAYRLSGNNAKAMAAYEDFLILWKDADANVPVLMEARSEYTAIRDQSR
jgi:DNA-binding winged helix-turn-helix (wHTH) protein/tetratricopeptide (TPR) repeat protein